MGVAQLQADPEIFYQTICVMKKARLSAQQGTDSFCVEYFGTRAEGVGLLMRDAKLRDGVSGSCIAFFQLCTVRVYTISFFGISATKLVNSEARCSFVSEGSEAPICCCAFFRVYIAKQGVVGRACPGAPKEAESEACSQDVWSGGPTSTCCDDGSRGCRGSSRLIRTVARSAVSSSSSFGAERPDSRSRAEEGVVEKIGRIALADVRIPFPAVVVICQPDLR